MKDKNEHINDLLDRFFEGETTCDDERDLYHFFTQDDIPEELIRYKPIMKYFESGLADVPSFSIQRKQLPVFNLKKRWIAWSGMAASLLIILFTSLYFLKDKDTSDPFEGSYIIRNGVCITDLNLIRPELEATILKTLLRQLEIEQFITELYQENNNVEMEIYQQMYAHHERILNNIQDEEIRNEVELILLLTYN